jgi:hypothetical protein
MRARTRKLIARLFLICLAWAVFYSSSHAETDCPPGADKVYCDIAQQTDGRVYSGLDETTLTSALTPETNRPPGIKDKTPHRYSPFSKDIGCDGVADGRSRDICRALSESLSWGWQGHATLAPGWKMTSDGVRKVYCDKHISRADLPPLLAVCGGDIHPYMSCIAPTDARLATGVEGLIKTVIAVDGAPEDLKDTIYDPAGKNYILRNGCGK